MNATGTIKAAEVTTAAREKAARTGSPVPRMCETLPSLAVREKLMVWVDKGRVRTSDGPMKGHEIAAVLLNTDNDSDTRREIVMPTHRDLRLLIRAFSKARFTTIDQRNAVLAARRVLDAALVTPWYSSLTIITKALAVRYWAPFEDTDDLHAWGRTLAVSNPRSVAGMRDLYRLAIRGTSTHGALTTRITAASDRITRARTFPGALNDAQAYVAMEALGDQWKTLCAVDETLRPVNLAARRTVAVVPKRPGRESSLERMLVPGGSVPFRSSSTVWVVDPDSPGSDLHGGKVACVRLRPGPVHPRDRPRRQGGLVVPCRLRARGVPGRGPVRRVSALHPQRAICLGERSAADRAGEADGPARTGPRRDGHHPRLTPRRASHHRFDAPTCRA